jgi:Ca2+-binding EF-hand superfamily protein
VLARVKKTILQYMIIHNLNVDELFAVLKTTNSKDISREEFVRSLSSKVTALSHQDLNDIFASIDVDHSGSISLTEI